MKTKGLGAMTAAALLALAALAAGPTSAGEEALRVGENKIVEAKSSLFFVSSRYFVRNWAVLGPFYYDPAQYPEDKAGPMIDVKFVDDEAGLEPAEGKEVKDGRRWLVYPGSGVSPEAIDLDTLYGKVDYACAYAVATVYSPEDVKAAVLLCGSDDFIRVWVNGKMVLTYNEKRRAAEADSDKVPGIALKQGWNKIVVKSVDVVGDWSFMLRLAPPAEGPNAKPGGYRIAGDPPKPKVGYKAIPRP